eukprot:CAMPEP_0185019948 /NCGR_PEP_ID=MMETSP1103-20130426/2532_1 /TAXON_ID=36769 /ORGANISM="Paraphysomonas bandaiensis, Strain Caron Lab Isolate" /LENGTH=895 /DNA_ID=CAMNT_0027550535 /DNA_START=54 /DNA_END=2741 /DNA_ORIENTATION=-
MTGSLAAMQEAVESIKSSLPEGHPLATIASIINRRNELKYSALHCAIFARNLETFTFIVESGGDINMKCHGTPPLHLAISTAILPGGFDFGISCALKLLTLGCDIDAKDDQGITALQLACEYNLGPIVENMIRTITSEDESSEGEKGTKLLDTLDAKDRRGNRALHHCAMTDAVNTAHMLLSNGASLMSVNGTRSTPLHVAAASGSRRVWSALLSSALETGKGLGAMMQARDIWQRTPVDTALAYSHFDMIQALPAEFRSGRTDQPAPRLQSSCAQTAIISHPFCRMHYTCAPSSTEDESAPPENIKRLAVLLDDTNGVLRARDLESSVVFIDDCRPAAMSDVLRVHEWPYVRRLQATCEDLAQRFGNPLSVHGGEDMEAEMEGGLAHLDGDTAVSKRSFDAAMRAAGSVCQAVDMVVAGQVRNAFCAVRPPGHHAGPTGLVKGEAGGPDSHGFCLLNNISIGAAYAMNVHRDIVKRVAIVDFDVHHGNGTEETIRWLKPGLDTTEVITPAMFGQMHTPRFKPWFDENDAKNVLFVSVHGYGPRERGLEQYMPATAFYPGTGRTVFPSTTPDAGAESLVVEGTGITGSAGTEAAPEIEEVADMDVGGSGDGDDSDSDDSSYRGGGSEGSGDYPTTLPTTSESKYERMTRVYGNKPSGVEDSMPPLILDVGVELPSGEFVQGEYRHQWRNYFRNVIFPRLMEFKPDCIFISAGFDAHKKDTINGGYISLVEEDYEWVTTNLIRIANTTCNGRVVSALEGGYQIRGEFCSSFAKSVKAHVSALCGSVATSNEVKYSTADAEVEMHAEKEGIALLHRKRQEKQAEADRQAAEWQKKVAEMQEMAKAEEAGEKETKEHNGECLETARVEVAATGDEDGSRSKRRRTAAKVDYVALNKKL